MLIYKATNNIIGCDNSLISKKCKTVTGEEFATAKNYHIQYIN